VDATPGVALVGHSFGGAVVIRVGVASPAVATVAALSSQSYGTEDVASLAPRPLFLATNSSLHIEPHALRERQLA